MSDERGSIWVYGVVPAGATLKEVERRGGDDIPKVSVVECGDLAAIVGDAPEDSPKGTRDQALAHARVLEAAVRDAPVVPFRFGAMAPDDEAVGGILEEQQEDLSSLLERLGPYVQMTLKVYYDEDAVLREIIDKEPEIADLRQQAQGDEEATRNVRARMGELVAKALEQRREADTKDLGGRLDGVTERVADDGLEKEFMVVNAACLVERERVQEFEEEVESLARERKDRMHFRLLGPMPAYAFIGQQEQATA